MIERDAFLKAEREASRRFMNKFVEEDFSAPGCSVGYSRTYRCDCGFTTSESAEIYDHNCTPLEIPKP